MNIKTSMVGRVVCVVCEGNGKYYTGKPDPIEGNKMRNLEQCWRCDGVGTVSSRTTVGKAMIAYWETYNKLEAQQKVVMDVLSILSDEDKEALKEYFKDT